jgi:hypothetical protein
MEHGNICPIGDAEKVGSIVVLWCVSGRRKQRNESGATFGKDVS